MLRYLFFCMSIVSALFFHLKTNHYLRSLQIPIGILLKLLMFRNIFFLFMTCFC